MKVGKEKEPNEVHITRDISVGDGRSGHCTVAVAVTASLVEFDRRGDLAVGTDGRPKAG